MSSTVLSSSTRRGVFVLAGLACAVYAAFFVAVSGQASYDLVGGLVVAPAAAWLGLLMAVRLAKRETDAALQRIVVGSFLLKVAAALIMYWITFEVYGSADANLYHRSGTVVAEGVWAGELGRGLGRLTGTGFLELFTGLVYAVTGPTRLGGFMVFAVLSWFGLYLFFRALPAGVAPRGRRLYAGLVFLLPSLLVWPSTIGKEPWMILTLGAAAYGASRLLHDQRGLVWLAAGLVGISIVRPHMTVLVLAGMAGAVVVSRPGQARGIGFFGRLVVVLVIVVSGALLSIQLQQFFRVDEVSLQSAERVFESTRVNTSIGGSQFDNAAVRNPVAIPAAFVSVVFRPFPFEADNPQSLVASLEGLALMGLMWTRRHTLMRLPRSVTRHPYVAFAATYTLGFVIAFSNFNNLGLLARERTQMFPLLFILLVVGGPPAERRRRAKG